MTRSSEKRKKAQASKPPLQIPSTMADSNYESSATGAELVRNASTWPVSSDATSDAPQEEGPAASANVQSGWALAEKYLFRGLDRFHVFLLLLLALDVILIYIDNKQGKLTDSTGLKWTLLKCAAVDGFLVGVALLLKLGRGFLGMLKYSWRRRPRWLQWW